MEELACFSKRIYLLIWNLEGQYSHPNLSKANYNKFTNSIEKIHESINKALKLFRQGILMPDLLYFGKMTLILEGHVFNNFLMSNNLEQLINKPTHNRDDGSQSCIDIICTDEPLVFMQTGVMLYLDSHSKHNIIHSPTI